MALTKHTMTNEQRKSVALDYLKPFDNAGVTSWRVPLPLGACRTHIVRTSTSLLPDQELFARSSLRDFRAVGASYGASALRYLACSMKARSFGETWRLSG